MEATDLEEPTKQKDPIKYHDAWKAVCTADGIIVPGGFGDRGIEGMILSIKWAREHNIPFLGICLGLQLAVVEFARNVLGIQSGFGEGRCLFRDLTILKFDSIV